MLEWLKMLQQYGWIAAPGFSLLALAAFFGLHCYAGAWLFERWVEKKDAEARANTAAARLGYVKVVPRRGDSLAYFDEPIQAELRRRNERTGKH